MDESRVIIRPRGEFTVRFKVIHLSFPSRKIPKSTEFNRIESNPTKLPVPWTSSKLYIVVHVGANNPIIIVCLHIASTRQNSPNNIQKCTVILYIYFNYLDNYRTTDNEVGTLVSILIRPSVDCLLRRQKVAVLEDKCPRKTFVHAGGQS